MSKRFFSLLSILIMGCLVLTGSMLVVSAEEDINNQDNIVVLIDEIELEFEDQEPVLVDSHTLVPLRAIFEAMGAEIEWEEATSTVTAVKEDITIILTIGKEIASINDENVELDVPAQLINARTMVPLRFVSEAMGAEVDWDGDTQTVYISTELASDEDEESEDTEVTTKEKIIAALNKMVEEETITEEQAEAVIELISSEDNEDIVKIDDEDLFSSLVEDEILTQEEADAILEVIVSIIEEEEKSIDESTDEDENIDEDENETEDDDEATDDADADDADEDEEDDDNDVDEDEEDTEEE